MINLTQEIIKSKVQIYVLLSGGLDSSATLVFYLRLNFDVKALFINFGQASAKQELKAAKFICEYYNIPLSIITAKYSCSFKKGEILGRNAFLIFTALMMSQKQPSIIAIGIHDGSPYYDCNDGFIKNIQAILDGYTSGTIKIAAPFSKWNKPMIWEFCKKNNIPIESTYSCEKGGIYPCKECFSCKDREALNVM